MNNNPQCPEGRQHINLSNYAYLIVKNDSQTFMGAINYSGFINRIVLNSMLESFDDLASNENERISNELVHYTKLGRKTHLTETDRETIKKIATAHRNYQIASFTHYPKDVPLKIRLNKELHDIFYPVHSDWSGIQHNISQGDYIKSLVEDYARKTIFDRESIFYKSIISDFETILDMDKENRKRILITLSNGERYILKPYRLSYDYEADYHYIIGMGAEYGSNNFIPVSYRISRIEKFSPRSTSSGSGKITEKEKKEIEQKIKDSGVPYILGNTVKHVVKLTPVGMNMYNSIFHQRPAYEHIEKNKDGSGVLTFIATQRQITNYFFTFAQEAELISPNETRLWMQNRYKSAFESYNNNPRSID